MNPAVVSLKGYADVNRELLTSVIIENLSLKINCKTKFVSHFQSVATITIYLIVLLQFKLSLIAQQLPPSLTHLLQKPEWLHEWDILIAVEIKMRSQRDFLSLNLLHIIDVQYTFLWIDINHLFANNWENSLRYLSLWKQHYIYVFPMVKQNQIKTIIYVTIWSSTFAWMIRFAIHISHEITEFYWLKRKRIDETWTKIRLNYHIKWNLIGL